MLKTIQNSSFAPIGTAPNLLPITKSAYLQYLACPPEFWYLKHFPEEYSGAPDEVALHTMEQGNELDQLARDYYVQSDNLQVDIQQKFKSGRLLAKADIVLTETGTRSKTLIEVKSGTSVKPEYLDDLAFQVIAAEAVGISFDQIGVLHVNSAYVFNGTLNIQELFVFEDVTEAVLALIPETQGNIEAAIQYLQAPEPVMHLHEYCGQKLDCPVIQKQHPNLPDYSVFDISRINAAKLRDLLKNGLVDIHQVPNNFDISPKQRLQVEVAQTDMPIVNKRGIKTALDGLQFPLYFLDYETLVYGVPFYEGIKPYQQMVFQWSLHVLHADGITIEHFDFLSDGNGAPSMAFAQALQQAIPRNGGSVLVWNKAFEIPRNNELAQMYPEFEPFMTDINARVYDLMEIFQQQHFVHPAFKGSCSIKQVLPVVAPHLSYHDLEINHGMLASIRWFELVTGKFPDSEKDLLFTNLREYCKLDTLAMVEVYKYLRIVCNQLNASAQISQS